MGLVSHFLTGPDLAPWRATGFIEPVSKLESLESDYAKIRQSTSQFAAQLRALSSVPDESKLMSAIEELREKTKSLAEKYDAIEKAIGDSPLKAISLPLMQKDVASVNQRITEMAIANQQQIDRLYDQNKWFLGLMVTIAIGVIGLAVGNLYRGNKKE